MISVITNLESPLNIINKKVKASQLHSNPLVQEALPTGGYQEVEEPVPPLGFPIVRVQTPASTRAAKIFGS
jgi:hypothetical protein